MNVKNMGGGYNKKKQKNAITIRKNKQTKKQKK